MKSLIAFLDPLFVFLFNLGVRKGWILCAQNFAFLSYGATQTQVVGGAAGIVTLTVGVSQTGLPATAVRLWNAGTANAFIMMGNGTTLTVTGAAQNGMPVPVSVAPFVLRTGGVSPLQFGTTSTFTTTIYVSGGEGID